MRFGSLLIKQQVFRDALVIAVLCIFSFTACTTTEEKCANLNAELTETFNAYIDEKPGVTGPQIMRQCKSALEQCPNLAIAYELMGMVELERENVKACLANYIQAIELAPSNGALLTEARSMVFLSNGKYLYVNEAGKVEFAPFKTITLDEYAGLSDDVRLLWCTAKLGVVPEEKTEYVFTDQNGEYVDSMQFGYTSISPSELDARLVSEAQSNPKQKLSEEAFLITAGSLNYERLD